MMNKLTNRFSHAETQKKCRKKKSNLMFETFFAPLLYRGKFANNVVCTIIRT